MNDVAHVNVLGYLDKFIENPKMITDPTRPRVRYHALLQAIEAHDDGWHLRSETTEFMFVEREAGPEAMHDMLQELACRYNGFPLHPQRNWGPRA